MWGNCVKQTCSIEYSNYVSIITGELPNPGHICFLANTSASHRKNECWDEGSVIKFISRLTKPIVRTDPFNVIYRLLHF